MIIFGLGRRSWGTDDSVVSEPVERRISTAQWIDSDGPLL